MSNNSLSNTKITIVCSQYPPEKGAAASRMAYIASGLRARNVDVNVITALPNYPTGRIFPGYRGKLWHSESIDGIPVKRYWLYPSNSAKTIMRILNMISFSATLLLSVPHLLRIRPKIIVVNSPPLPVGLIGVILARISGARAITNISDIWPLSALELGAMQKGWFYSLLEKIENYVYRHSDAIVTQSDETRRHILERCPDKKIFLYRNLDYTSEFIDQSPMMETQTPRIVYAGLLGVAQGVAEICSKIDFRGIGAEFHIYGDGNERAIIAQYVAENPGCNIILHDSVPKTEMPKILAQFHATIVPLKTGVRGAFPSKVYMAMSASLPVLFCGSGEGAHFVRESGIGWVTDPGDYRGLSENIENLRTMTDHDYLALRDRIKSLATSTYNLEDQLNRLMDFIDGVK